MACGSCGLQLSFGKRRGSKRRSRRASKRSSKLRHRRRGRRSKKLLEEIPKRRRHRRRRSRRNRRFFGIVAGPGFKGQTSYSNAYAPYFGSREPFVTASEWWAPKAGGVPQYPQMLYKNGGPVNYPGN